MHNLRDLILDDRINKALFLLRNNTFTLYDILEKDPEDNTALHWAVKMNHEPLINALLSHGADCCKYMGNQHGQTPYDIARQKSLAPRILHSLNPYLPKPINDNHHSKTEETVAIEH